MTIEKRVLSILCDQMGIPEERITPDLLIMGEIDSPDHLELIMEVEEEFDITIPNEDVAKLQTVAQVIRYVQEHPGGPKGHRASGSRSDALWDNDLDG